MTRSRDVNFSTVSGYVVEDAQVRMTKAGQPLAWFRVANEVTVGSTVYESFYNVHCFGDLGRRVVESVHRGDRVIMFGRWHERAFKDERLGIWRRYQNFVADEVAISVMNRMSEWRQAREVSPTSQAELGVVAERRGFDNPVDPYGSE